MTVDTDPTLDTDVTDSGVSETDDAPLLDSDDSLLDELSKAFEDTGDTDGTDGSGDDEVSDESDSGVPDEAETITVKVDGEEVEVTIDELRDGYSRQADYTKKTQALAAERERLAGLEQLAHALETDPQATLAELSKALGVPGPGGSTSSTDDVDDELLDPVEIQVRELQTKIEQLSGKLSEREAADREAQEDAALQAQLDQIRRENADPNLDDESLLRFAIENKINDLPTAYKFMKLEMQTSKPASEDKLEAKRGLPPIESGGGRRNSKSGGGKIMSIKDALEATLRETSG